MTKFNTGIHVTGNKFKKKMKAAAAAAAAMRNQSYNVKIMKKRHLTELSLINKKRFL
jgi:hypothetical protein